MNRLRGSLTYLVGPMDRTKDGGVEWRKKITPLLQKRGILVIDPCNKPVDSEHLKEDDINREKRKIAKAQGKYSIVGDLMKPVRNIDLRFVDKADFIIVHFDDECKPCGTYEELFLANKQKKPVLLHCENGISNLPDWLFAVLPHKFFFENWDDLLEYIRHIDEDDNVDLLNRWRPIDFSKLIDIDSFNSLFQDNKYAIYNHIFNTYINNCIDINKAYTASEFCDLWVIPITTDAVPLKAIFSVDYNRMVEIKKTVLTYMFHYNYLKQHQAYDMVLYIKKLRAKTVYI